MVSQKGWSKGKSVTRRLRRRGAWRRVKREKERVRHRERERRRRDRVLWRCQSIAA